MGKNIVLSLALVAGLTAVVLLTNGERHTPRVVALPETQVSSSAVEGSIETMDFSAPMPRLTLKTPDGAIVEFELDSEETVVLRSGSLITIDELARGQRIKVHYLTNGEGMEVATSILVLGPLPTFPPAS